ncbi:MAG: hypothetical protein ACE5PV_12685, partial [Candidatus Poribacteria bacterium]
MTENKRKAPYKWLSITLILIISAVLVIVFLAFKQKTNVVVDIELIANQISFSVKGNAQRLEPVRADSIVLTNFKEIGFAPDRFFYDGKTVSVKGKVLLRPWRDALSPRVRFIGDGIRLVELVIGIGSRVTFHKSEGEEAVYFKVEPELGEESVEPSEGKMSLGNSFKLLMERCDLVDEEGNALINRNENIAQRALEIFPSLDKTSFLVSNGQKVFRVVLEKPEENVTLFSNASIRQIDFNDYDIATGKSESTVKSGTVKFKNIKKENLPLESRDFIYISERDRLKVVKLWPNSKDNSLGIALSGAIDSLKLGKGVLIEQLPSLLEWLAANKRLQIIIAVLGWIIAQALTVRNLINEMKK